MNNKIETPLDPQKLPPQVRSRINKLAHELALAAEASIHDRLTAQAQNAGSTSPDDILAALAMTEADWQAMAWKDGALEGWLEAHGAVLLDGEADAGHHWNK